MPVTEKQLRKLSRIELMELLLEQGKRIRVLEDRLEKADAALSRQTLTQAKAGTMAEAALQLNGIFEAADAACKQYIKNIQRLSWEMEARSSEKEDVGDA